MLRRAHLVEDAGDFPSWINDRRGTNDSQEFLTHELLWLPHAVRLGDRVVLVREEREGQIVLVLELRLFLRRVRTGTKDD